MSSISINGRNTYDYYDALLTSRSTPPPKVKDISATIPYRDGDICFTYQNGKAAYDTRSLTYTFEFFENSTLKLRQKINDFENWLYNSKICKITDEIGETYTALLISYTEEWSGYHCKVKVQFTADPYKLSADFSDSAWDSFNFESDCLNADIMTVTAKPPAQYSEYTEIHIFNFADYPITPRVSYGGYRHYPGLVSLSVNGVAYYPNYYYHDTDEWFNANFSLQPGDNVVKVLGWGTLTFEMREECL